LIGLLKKLPEITAERYEISDSKRKEKADVGSKNMARTKLPAPHIA